MSRWAIALLPTDREATILTGNREQTGTTCISVTDRVMSSVVCRTAPSVSFQPVSVKLVVILAASGASVAAAQHYKFGPRIEQGSQTAHTVLLFIRDSFICSDKIKSSEIIKL